MLLVFHVLKMPVSAHAEMKLRKCAYMRSALNFMKAKTMFRVEQLGLHRQCIIRQRRPFMYYRVHGGIFEPLEVKKSKDNESKVVLRRADHDCLADRNGLFKILVQKLRTRDGSLVDVISSPCEGAQHFVSNSFFQIVFVYLDS